MTTKIEWTEQTWNPVVGCSKVSTGCENCYAEKMTCRLAAMGLEKYETVEQWNGKTCFDGKSLEAPLKRKKQTMYFVCSMGDLFHESVTFEVLDRVFATMAICPQHTFQVLTKRPQRMAKYYGHRRNDVRNWQVCLPNVWLGVTVENQKAADERIETLSTIPAPIHFVSCEPLLEELSWHARLDDIYGWVDWVIIGCESGANRRPCKIEWMQSIVNKCKDADVPVFVKQVSINGKVNKEMTDWPEGLRVREYPKVVELIN